MICWVFFVLGLKWTLKLKKKKKKKKKSDVSFTWILAGALGENAGWERKLTGQIPTLRVGREVSSCSRGRRRGAGGPGCRTLAVCQQPGLSRSAFLRLDLGLHLRHHVTRPVAHSALAWDLNKNKLQVLTVIDGLLLHLCIFALRLKAYALICIN